MWKKIVAMSSSKYFPSLDFVVRSINLKLFRFASKPFLTHLLLQPNYRNDLVAKRIKNISSIFMKCLLHSFLVHYLWLYFPLVGLKCIKYISFKLTNKYRFKIRLQYKRRLQSHFYFLSSIIYSDWHSNEMCGVSLSVLFQPVFDMHAAARNHLAHMHFWHGRCVASYFLYFAVSFWFISDSNLFRSE